MEEITNNQSAEEITNKHADFKRLMYAIDKEMSMNGGCKHTYSSFFKACKILESIREYKIDRAKTLKWMKDNGGYCDCEILMNVQLTE